ncbi:MAG: dihydroorotase [Flavobacteriales bacterium]|mgnify:FL=1|nr:dihydroorotase [Flavobacteriales bacterium]
MGLIIKNANKINEGAIEMVDVLIENEIIQKISSSISTNHHQVIDIEGAFLLPGVIDDQVHFREPGLTHKGTIYSESRAAVAGGITSFMEMPNTKPAVLTQDLLQDKFHIGRVNSLANFSFFMGVSNDNIDEVLKTDFTKVPGLKIFMGSSTGNMLVDDFQVLNNIFSNAPGLIAVHCEDEETIRQNSLNAKNRYGDAVPISEHPKIRSHEACFKSSSLAVDLAKKYSSRLHILHISTAKELELFTNEIELEDKKITSEVCIHHLSFSDADYAEKGSFIKWNPAVKTKSDQSALWEGLLNNKLDIIATDHAPHTFNEKQNLYFSCPSGAPMVQHALPMMLQHTLNQKLSLEHVVEKMCHAPAKCFKVNRRGFIREGYYADLVVVNKRKWQVNENNILYACNWSPLNGYKFDFQISHTFVNGNLVYKEGNIINKTNGKELDFDN